MPDATPRFRDQPPDDVHSVAAGKQRHGRLVVAHLRLQRLAIAFRHVRRVGHDQVERPLGYPAADP